MDCVFVLLDDHDTQFGLVNGNFTFLNPKIRIRATWFNTFVKWQGILHNVSNGFITDLNLQL